MKRTFKILLVEDLDSFRGAVRQLLGVYNDVDEAADLSSARTAIQKNTYDVVILDKGLPDGDGISLISEVKDENPNAVVIMLTSDSDFSSVKHCMVRGADDYVIKSDNVIPDLLVRIPLAVAKAASQRRLHSLEDQVKRNSKYEIVGKSKPTMELRETILSLKQSQAHVLITGESGTGKELIARRLNAIEGSNRPLVTVNCGAIPENLFESELFGHKKGSFTGATEDKPGCFELAHEGDLFLDEIGELPLNAQVKLLRVIQDGTFRRVGGSKEIEVKCRVLAATNKSLEKLVTRGKFREDLFHRLNVVRISTTPLRLRMEDIGDLAKLFVLQVGGAEYSIGDKAIRALQNYDWPGNVRELRNTIERALISARRRQSIEILYDDITHNQPINNASYRMRKLEASLPLCPEDLSVQSYNDFLLEVEKEYLTAALDTLDGNVTTLAHKIGVGRSTLFKKLNRFGIVGRSVAHSKKNQQPSNAMNTRSYL